MVPFSTILLKEIFAQFDCSELALVCAWYRDVEALLLR